MYNIIYSFAIIIIMSEYDSDEYIYESENESDYEEKIDYNSSADYKEDDKLNIKFLDSYKIIPTHIYNSLDKTSSIFEWSVLCLKLYYNYNNDSICYYDYNVPTEIIISNLQYKIKLFIEPSSDKLNCFPNVPFKVTNVGAKLNIYDELRITKNIMLLNQNWNICFNVYEFIENVILIISNYKYNNSISIDFEHIIYNITNKIQLNFNFNLSYLPQFGVNTKNNNKNKSSYSWTGNNSENSLCELLFNDISLINNMYTTITHNLDYIKIIHLILDRILESELTFLEYNVNQSFYEIIIQLINKSNYDYDLTIFDKFNDVDVSNTDKIMFTDNLIYHSFQNKTFSFTPKFTKRIMSEIKNIEQAISDIDCYLYISENNISLFKILMIPDKDTPYAYGFFEFDMFIPSDYPNSPPNVKFLTTGNSKIRFNPNLYQCGKVCLSILNTWNSNQWNPKSSTISQVLLSIYSMIFNEHPWTNEPAFYDSLKSELGRRESEKYNNQIRQFTFQYAINEQLKNTQTPFKHIINSLYQKNKSSITNLYS